MSRLVAVAPDTRPVMHEAFAAAVRDAGGEVAVSAAELAEAGALVWADPYAAGLYPEVIASLPAVEWVQLPYAGIEPFVDYLDERLVWACAKGVYADPVAEWVMAALLMGLRDFHLFAAARSWCAETGRNLLGTRITVLGGGGITRSLLRLLAPWGCEVTVVRRSDEPVAGAARALTLHRVNEAVAGADAVVVALALTSETQHVVDAALLESMGPQCWLVNVARGGHVDHAALGAALRSGVIAGAVLDVTDPEPLARQLGAVGAAELCHHAPHRQHPRDGPAVDHRAGAGERAALAGRRGSAGPGRHSPRLLIVRPFATEHLRLRYI